MNELISFHKSIDSLNDNEYHELLNSIGRGTVTKLMFHALQHEMHNDHMNTIRKINETIRNLTEMRKQKQNRSNNTADDNDYSDIEQDTSIDNEVNEQIKMQLDDLPNVMLFEISSFLSFAESIQFTRTNRNVFIGARSVTVPRYLLSTTQFSKLQRYCHHHSTESTYLSKRNVFNSLEVNCDEIMELCENTCTPVLKYDCDHSQLYEDIQRLKIMYSWSDFPAILLSECATLANIHTLTLIHTDETDFGSYFPDVLIDLVNLQHFEIIGHCFDADFIDETETETDYKFISSLKGFAISMEQPANTDDTNSLNYVMERVYRNIGSNLQSFHQGFSTTTATIEGKLNELKEICLPFDHPTDECIQILLRQELNQLERVYFRGTKNGPHAQQQLLMDKMMNKAKYIGVDARYEFADVVMNRVWTSLKDIQKDTIKIRLERVCISPNTISYAVALLVKIVESLSANCVDWMLIGYKWNRMTGSVLLSDLLDTFKEKHNVIHQMEADSSKEYCTFVISNKQCKINGYYERWIMPCHCCQQLTLFA
eukprot:169369_1